MYPQLLSSTMEDRELTGSSYQTKKEKKNFSSCSSCSSFLKKRTKDKIPVKEKKR